MEYIYKIIFGVLGGYLTYYVINMGIKRALSKETNGKLYFGGYLFIWAIIFTVSTVAMIWVLFYTNHGGQEIAITLLIAMFGLSAIYMWIEYIWTKGFFDNDEIHFKSLWRGNRCYSWSKLVSVKYNESLYWYVLKFSDNKTIRLSVYLNGHGDLLNKIENMGYSF
ncbi:MAG: hypothetical protein OEX12_03700 [Gammaproteobacteria bacterium]|nr:hypothetical protein [Gammaproteobacteria bacterium]